MNTGLHLPTLALVAALQLAPAAQAAPFAFTAAYDGQSQIVEIVDPNGPVVRVQSSANGPGVKGLEEYFSEDVINLATGAGTGVNRFRAASGDELFGSFIVQLVPTGVPGVLDILGMVTFQGGTGRFLHAAGWADLIGRGAFIDEDTANSRFEFSGELRGVPEPGSLALLLIGLAALPVRGPRRKHTVRN